MAVGWQALIVGVIAGFVGLAELLARYRSDPKFVLRHSAAAWLYIAANAGAGVGALYITRAFGWTFGQTQHVDLWRVLVAGFGAIAFFRSSLFIARIGGTDVGVGPSLVLGSLLDAFDREVDRKSAEKISHVLESEELRGLDPENVMNVLPVICLALMQNFPPGDQALLGAEITNIRKNPDLGSTAKMQAVVVYLAKYLSADLVVRILRHGRAVFVETPPASRARVIDEARRITEEAGEPQPRGS